MTNCNDRNWAGSKDDVFISFTTHHLLHRKLRMAASSTSRANNAAAVMSGELESTPVLESFAGKEAEWREAQAHPPHRRQSNNKGSDNSNGIDNRPVNSRGRRQSAQNEEPRTFGQMYEQLCLGICRPPRMTYDYPAALGPSPIVLNHAGGMVAHRTDFHVINARGHQLECSIWKPEGLEASSFPCVVYLHGNSSSRVEAVKTSVLKAVMFTNSALVSFDFSGCGNSEGQYVSLGWFESEDTAEVIKEIRRMGAGKIVLYGRSMGAVTAILYAVNSSGSDAPAGLILDSPFKSFKQLAYDLTSKGMVRIPKFATATILSLIRRSVQNRAGFDLYRLKSISQVNRCYCPALFVVAEGDELIPPWHGEKLEEAYAGPSLGIRFDGSHNSTRPAVIYAFASVFITAVNRRHAYPVDMALHLIEKTAVVISQEDEEEGRIPTHPERYHGNGPRFIRTGSHSVSNIAGAAKALIGALDVTLACKAVEEYLLDEMLLVGTSIVQSQLQAGQAGKTPQKSEVLWEVSRAQVDHARDEIGNIDLARQPAGRTTWENLVTAEVESTEQLNESLKTLEVLKQAYTSCHGRELAKPPPACCIGNGSNSSNSLELEDGRVSSEEEQPSTSQVPHESTTTRRRGFRQHPAALIGGAIPKFCCFDARDIFSSQSRSKEEHLAELHEILHRNREVVAATPQSTDDGADGNDGSN